MRIFYLLFLHTELFSACWLLYKISNSNHPSLQHNKRSPDVLSTFPHFLCLHHQPRMGTCFFWIFPNYHFAKPLLPLAEGERYAHTCGQIHMTSSAAPTAPFPFSSPLHPPLGPRAGGVPGAEQGTSWSAVKRWALNSPSQAWAALLRQTGQGRSTLGNNMQIPWWGQQRGKSQRWGSGHNFDLREIKFSCV